MQAAATVTTIVYHLTVALPIAVVTATLISCVVLRVTTVIAPFLILL